MTAPDPDRAADAPVPMEERLSALREILAVVDRLRAPDGCPWDRAQTPSSMARYLLEEAAEAHDAVRGCDPAEASEELGDLLMVILLICRMEEQAGRFSIADAARGIAAKLVRRHPHVFGDVGVRSAEEVPGLWERIKAAEKATRGEGEASALDGVPRSLPALARAAKLGERAARVGFEWPDLTGPVAKIREELEEVLAAASAPDALGSAAVEAEVGDLLFAVVNLARHLRVAPETALRGTMDRFERRFRYVERELGKPAAEAELEEMERLWQRAKELERDRGRDGEADGEADGGAGNPRRTP